MDDIEQLEARIDELSAAIGRSRKMMRAGQLGALLGALLLVAMILGLMMFSAGLMLAAITLAIGGLVLTGSSSTSTQQLEGSLQAAQQARTAPIDRLNLVQVRTEWKH